MTDDYRAMTDADLRAKVDELTRARLKAEQHLRDAEGTLKFVDDQVAEVGFELILRGLMLCWYTDIDDPRFTWQFNLDGA